MKGSRGKARINMFVISRIKRALICAFLLLNGVPLIFAENKGSCPPPPPATAFNDAKRNAPAPTTTPEGDRVGTVSLLTVISDKGYVCSAKVLQGLGKRADDEAVNTIEKWRFRPAMKNGHAVPVVVNIHVNFRIDKDGNILAKTPAP